MQESSTKGMNHPSVLRFRQDLEIQLRSTSEKPSKPCSRRSSPPHWDPRDMSAPNGVRVIGTARSSGRSRPAMVSASLRFHAVASARRTVRRRSFAASSSRGMRGAPATSTRPFSAVISPARIAGAFGPR